MIKNYEAPEATIVNLNLSSPIAQNVPIGDLASGDGDAKENKDVFIEEQEESLPVDKNIWEDDEE